MADDTPVKTMLQRLRGHVREMDAEIGMKQVEIREMQARVGQLEKDKMELDREIDRLEAQFVK